MSKKKATIYTILFAILITTIIIVLMLIKPYDGEVSLFHALSPAFVGLWIGELIDKFYKWITK